MPNSVTVEVNGGDALKERFETLPAALKPFIKTAAKFSADHIRDEAKARLLRQLSGASSGRTVAGIVVRADRSGWGWIVDAGNVVQPMLDRWLEFGTETKLGTEKMRARPFFFDSARLEEAAHLSRIRGAVAAGISEHGLGDA